ncbi:hypothetical protein [Halococcus sediminicola]|uniref:hypothetical protein n=1 Tax=Halococcus sediminicola TaxID=1264579 RepID=UPI001929EE3E|nr:hypothetical protein [Halococcus sediminicola]
MTPLKDEGTPSERKVILDTLAGRIHEIDDRLDQLDPELDDTEAQRLQIRWTRTLGYLAGQYRKLMKDTDIDEMEEDIELLQQISKANQ